MELIVHPSTLKGKVDIPGSKSHTIRAVVFATLASGKSRIIKPLDSADTRSALGVARAFGAGVEEGKDWIITGTGGKPAVPENVVDVGNSGTSLRLGMGIAALCDGYTVFTGDFQVRRRPVGTLIDAYKLLGAEGVATRGNGCAPLVMKGRITGGRTEIKAVSSQFLSSLLISTPLAEKNSEIRVLQLNEVPYVEMTLAWLDTQHITYENKDWQRFIVKGGQRYASFDRLIPADFSSATFFLCAAAITGGELLIQGLDMKDVQGDKAVAGFLKAMGAELHEGAKGIMIRGGGLKGGEFDLNAIPDALPALAVTACSASGETKLRNVPQARIKETDRITVMAQELKKMGGDVRELPDGLVIRPRPLKGAKVGGHHDHRVVMALAIAGLMAKGETIIDTAEAMSVTFPNFVDLMKGCGANMELREATSRKP